MLLLPYSIELGWKLMKKVSVVILNWNGNLRRPRHDVEEILTAVRTLYGDFHTMERMKNNYQIHFNREL